MTLHLNKPHSQRSTKVLAAGQAKTYKSPQSKLVRFFEKSRNQWKSKYLAVKVELKRLQNRVRFLERSKGRLKRRVRELEVDLRKLKTKLHVTEKKLESYEAKRVEEDTRVGKCPGEKLVYLMIVDPLQSQAVRERETAEIAMAMETWAQAFSADSPEDILSLYAEDSVLWGTLSPLRRDTPAAIRDYFAEAFILMERKVTFTDPMIRVYGDTAVNTGYYTFSWIRDSKAEMISARYSMTYVKRYQRWLIVEHHSSVIVEPSLKSITL